MAKSQVTTTHRGTRIWFQSALAEDYRQLAKERMSEKERRKLFYGEFPVIVGVDHAEPGADVTVRWPPEQDA